MPVAFHGETQPADSSPSRQLAISLETIDRRKPQLIAQSSGIREVFRRRSGVLEAPEQLVNWPAILVERINWADRLVG